VVIPLAPDLCALPALRDLGQTLHSWRQGWKVRVEALPTEVSIKSPLGQMQPAGYVMTQRSARAGRFAEVSPAWNDQVSRVYRESVLGESSPPHPPPGDDPHRLARLQHYRSLMPMAMDAHKPMFFLKPADGAIGSHIDAVRACYQDFESLARRIAANAGVTMP
jgi:hypothetical protein